MGKQVFIELATPRLFSNVAEKVLLRCFGRIMSGLADIHVYVMWHNGRAQVIAHVQVSGLSSTCHSAMLALSPSSACTMLAKRQSQVEHP